MDGFDQHRLLFGLGVVEVEQPPSERPIMDATMTAIAPAKKKTTPVSFAL